MAVFSLLLGILSATALVSKLMWCVPIVGVTLAVVALRTISKNQSIVVGRGAAYIGLALGLLFFTSATAGHFVRQRTLCRLARPHTKAWIEMVREGRLYEAHQLTLDQEKRERPGTNLRVLYETTEEMRVEMEAFFGESPLKEIVELGRQGQLRFEADEEVSVARDSGKNVDFVVQRYAIVYEVDGKPTTLSFMVSITRDYDANHREARWRVREVFPPDSAAS